jgi:hypothetical protein
MRSLRHSGPSAGTTGQSSADSASGIPKRDWLCQDRSEGVAEHMLSPMIPAFQSECAVVTRWGNRQ